MQYQKCFDDCWFCCSLQSLVPSQTFEFQLSPFMTPLEFFKTAYANTKFGSIPTPFLGNETISLFKRRGSMNEWHVLLAIRPRSWDDQRRTSWIFKTTQSRTSSTLRFLCKSFNSAYNIILPDHYSPRFWKYTVVWQCAFLSDSDGGQITWWSMLTKLWRRILVGIALHSSRVYNITQ